MLTFLLALLALAVALALVVVVTVVGDVARERRALLDTSHAWRAAEAREVRRAADRALRLALGQSEAEPRPDGSDVLPAWGRA